MSLCKLLAYTSIDTVWMTIDPIQFIQKCPIEIKAILLEHCLQFMDPRDRYLLREHAQHCWNIRIFDRIKAVSIPWKDNQLPIKYHPVTIGFMSSGDNDVACLVLPIAQTMNTMHDRIELGVRAYAWYHYIGTHDDQENYFLFYEVNTDKYVIHELL